MGASSDIEWTQATWNPVTGCTKFSAGCENCYAEVMARRLRAMGQPNYARGFEVALHTRMLQEPLRWKRPRLVFVNSMSDLFHPAVPDSFIHEVFAVMAEAGWHRYQVLTKRSERLWQMAPTLKWPENVWVGVTVERADYVARIDDLRAVPAAVRFLSIEPMLGPMPGLNLEGINWVIVGGESGPRARPVEAEWVSDVRDQCIVADVPFFFKQWGGRHKKSAGRELDGRTWDALPGMPAGAIA